MVASTLAITACGYGLAHRVPGSDMALPTSVADQFIASLVRQCEVTRIPAAASEDAKQETCPARSDTAAGQAGTVARPAVRVP
jgi:hypothetical protein